jgi:hypothetical protein
MNRSRKGLRAAGGNPRRPGAERTRRASREEAEKCQFILALFTSGVPRDAMREWPATAATAKQERKG